MARAEILEGKENHGPRVGESCQQFLGDRARMVATRLLLAIRADGLADFCKEEPQQVGEFGGGADGRAGRTNRIFLLDRNRGTDVGDPIDVGPVHLIEKHPRVGRKRFHIAPLSLGEQGIEGEGGFSRSRESGDRRHLVVRDAQRYVFEIILARAFDDQVVGSAIWRTTVCHGNGSFRQDAEKVRQRRSRFAQRLHVPNEYASPLRSLRPCWTAMLSILRDVFLFPAAF